MIDVYAFGAVGDGVADDTAAWQAAINAAQANGDILTGTGVFRTTAPLLITAHIRLLGSGHKDDGGAGYRGVGYVPSPLTMGGTSFLPEMHDCFQVVTSDAVHLEGFQVSYPLTAGSPFNVKGIKIEAPAGTDTANMHSVLRDITITRPDFGVKLVNCLEFRVENVNCMYVRKGSIVVESPNFPYAGDSSITGCTMWGGASTNTFHLLVNSCGGIRVTNNKFNAGAPNTSSGILIQPSAPTGGHVEPLIIANNSIEGQHLGICFNRAPGSDTDCTQFVIVGNQIWAGYAAIWMNAATTGTPIWIRGGVINGNVFCINGGVGVPCVRLDGVADTALGINTYASVNGQGIAAVKTANTANLSWGNAYASVAPPAF